MAACAYAEFSSRWRKRFSHLCGGSALDLCAATCVRTYADAGSSSCTAIRSVAAVRDDPSRRTATIRATSVPSLSRMRCNRALAETRGNARRTNPVCELVRDYGADPGVRVTSQRGKNVEVLWRLSCWRPWTLLRHADLQCRSSGLRTLSPASTSIRPRQRRCRRRSPRSAVELASGGDDPDIGELQQVTGGLAIDWPRHRDDADRGVGGLSRGRGELAAPLVQGRECGCGGAGRPRRAGRPCQRSPDRAGRPWLRIRARCSWRR